MKGWMVAAAGALVLLLMGASFWAGIRWQQGSDAQAQLKDTTTSLQATRGQLTTYHQRMQDAASRMESDSQALHAIAEDYAHARDQQLAFTTALGQRVRHWLAQHPAGAGCDIGPDGLRLWNDANGGHPAAGQHAGTGTAASAHRRRAAGSVPAAAASAQRQAAGAAGQSRGHHRPLSRLPHAPGQAGKGRNRPTSPASETSRTRQGAGGGSAIAAPLRSPA